MTHPPLVIRQFEMGPMLNFVYFAGDGLRNEVLVIDPAWDAGEIIQKAELEKLALRGILLTHCHYDHTNAVVSLLKKKDVPVYVHKADAPHLGFKHANLRLLEGGDRVPCGGLEFEAIHTPGHSPGSQCYKLAGNLFTGDTLFVGGCGRYDLPGGDEAEMRKSLSRLAKLPGETVVYPGHDYGGKKSSTIHDECLYNPFLASCL